MISKQPTNPTHLDFHGSKFYRIGERIFICRDINEAAKPLIDNPDNPLFGMMQGKDAQGEFVKWNINDTRHFLKRYRVLLQPKGEKLKTVEELEAWIDYAETIPIHDRNDLAL